jgi:hypothetical protein
MGDCLAAWLDEAPQFGRETTDWFIDRPLTNVAQVVAGCRKRLAVMDQVQAAGLTPPQHQRLDYQRGLEEFTAAFYAAQVAFQESQDLWGKGDLAGARRLMAPCEPGKVIEQFARFSSIGGITRGEQGLIVSLNTRWLSHIVGHRQALGLEPVRIAFGPTSHDPLAQSPGRFTFHFGPNSELWECQGQEETGAPAFRLPPDVAPSGDDSVPETWREICRSGVESEKPLRLTIKPILGRAGRAAALAPGNYRLRLLLLDPDSTASNQRVFDVKVAEAPVERVDVYRRAGGPRRVVALTYPVTLKSAGVVEVTLTPVEGKVLLCGAMLEPEGWAPSAHASSFRK